MSRIRLLAISTLNSGGPSSLSSHILTGTAQDTYARQRRIAEWRCIAQAVRLIASRPSTTVSAINVGDKVRILVAPGIFLHDIDAAVRVFLFICACVGSDARAVLLQLPGEFKFSYFDAEGNMQDISVEELTKGKKASSSPISSWGPLPTTPHAKLRVSRLEAFSDAVHGDAGPYQQLLVLGSLSPAVEDQ